MIWEYPPDFPNSMSLGSSRDVGLLVFAAARLGGCLEEAQLDATDAWGNVCRCENRGKLTGTWGYLTNRNIGSCLTIFD